MWRGYCEKSPGHDEEGQATLEFVVVMLGLLAVIVALSALVSAGERGALASLASHAASHAVGGTNPGGALLDVLMY